MKNQLNEALNAIGALAETSRVFYTTLIIQGFSKRQALSLTKVYIQAMICQSKEIVE